MTENLILAFILIFVIAAAGRYVIKAKRSGAKCIGCPLSGSCASKSKKHCCQHSSCLEEDGKRSTCSCHTARQ